MNRSPNSAPCSVFIKQRVFAVQHGTLQCLFADVVIERRSRLAQKRGQPFPVPAQTSDGFAQPRVWLGSVLVDLRFQLGVQLLHDRSAVFLMKMQPLFRRQFLFPCQRVVVINAAQRLQHIPALMGEVRRDFDELPSAMRQTVRQQNLHTTSQLRSVAR